MTAAAWAKRQVGATGLFTHPMGFGALQLSLDTRPPEAEAIRVLHRALALGVTFIDTADSYCRDDSERHHNERLIRRALQTYPGDTRGVAIATKAGMVRPGGAWVTHCEPEHLRRAIHASFEALGGERPIDLWQLHTVDPRYRLEDCLQVAREAVEQGLVRYVGLSNVSIAMIQRARRVLPVTSVQNEFNPWQRGSEFTGVLAFCQHAGIAFLPWSPLGGPHRSQRLSDIPGLMEMARERGASVPRLVLAWMMAKAPCIIPIPGASRLSTLEDSLAATGLDLTPEEVRRIDQLTPHRRREL